MGLGLRRCHKLIANAFRQRHINQRIAVDMPDLTMAERELDAAKPMRTAGDAFPVPDFELYPFASSKNTHCVLLLVLVLCFSCGQRLIAIGVQRHR